MPTKTRMLDDGNFVYAPDAPRNAAFFEYLEFADRLLGEWQRVSEACARLPFSQQTAERKKELDRAVDGFVVSFRPHYTIKYVRRDPTFLPPSQFFARHRPVREPFSILHCNLEMPLHTVRAFRDHADLDRVNKALDEDVPLAWWQSGPHDRPCYLFGNCVWELKPSETGQSDEGLVVLFAQMSERYQATQQGAGSVRSTVTPDADFIPEKVRLLVWRRSHGKCAQCGGREALDFDFVRPVRRGEVARPDDVQLLCAGCLREKQGVA